MDPVIVPDNYMPVDTSIYSNPYFALMAVFVLIVFAIALRTVFNTNNNEYVHNHQFE